MNPYINIIIPIHNSEKWLPYCLDSLVNQTNKNFSVIAVLDNCTDNSERVIKDYQSKIEIQYYSVEYRNAGAARNFGLDNCTAQYCTFLDSDDTLTADCVNVFYLLAFGGDYPENNIYTFRIRGRVDEMGNKRLNANDLAQNTCVGRLYNVAFLNRYKIRFPCVSLCEDFLFFAKCKTYSLKESGGIIGYIDVDRIIYNVVRNDESKYKAVTLDERNKMSAFAATFIQYADEGTQYITLNILLFYPTELARLLFCNADERIKHRLYQNLRHHPQTKATIKRWYLSAKPKFWQILKPTTAEKSEKKQ